MKKKLLLGVFVLLSLILLGSYFIYQHKGTYKIQTSESPEEVVKKFYSYISDGGPTSLGEAFRLISTRPQAMSEDSFNSIVLNYPKDLKVKVNSGRLIDNKAIVPIEYTTASAFGGDYTVKTEINLVIDENSKSWKIDFAGDTYDSGGGV